MLKLYVSRTSGNLWMSGEQAHIRRVLDSKQIEYQEIDVGDPHNIDDKRFMQNTLKLSDEDIVALPPQIFNKDQHRGDYEGFVTALECEHLFKYLDLDPPEHEVEYEVTHAQETERTV